MANYNPKVQAKKDLKEKSNKKGKSAPKKAKRVRKKLKNLTNNIEHANEARIQELKNKKQF